MDDDKDPIIGHVQHYQRSIERAQDNEKKLLYCIEKLCRIPITVVHLQETGIGKTVNALRKYDGEIGVAAKSLVTKWKAMVAAEECLSDVNNSNYEEEQQIYNGNEYANEENNAYEPQHVSELHVEQPEEKASNSKSSTDKHKHRHREHHSKDRSHISKSKISEESTEHQKEERSSREKAEKHQRRSGDKDKSEKRRDHSSRHGKEAAPHREHSEKRRDKDKRHHDVQKSSAINDETNSTTTTIPSNSMHSLVEPSTPKASKEKPSDAVEKHHKNELDSKSKEHKRDKHKSSKNKESSHHKSSSARKRHHEHENTAATPQPKIPKIQHENVEGVHGDGIDSSMGANFADVLGMLNMPSSRKSKKTATATQKSPQTASNTSSSKSLNGLSTTFTPRVIDLEAKPELLTSAAKLKPLDPSIALDLPTISNNYKPMPLNQTVMDCVFKTNTSSATKTPLRTLSDAEALQHGISSKTMRTKIYSGARTGQIYQVPSLFDLCIRMLQKNIDALEYTGGVPFEVLKPVLERATPEQLLTFEDFNPYLMEDSDVLWQQHVKRKYRAQKREEMESWREMFIRCQEDQDRRLSRLAESIKEKEKIIAAPVRKTQLAYIDTMVKPPRNVQRKQEQFGTRAKVTATPAARVAALSNGTPNAARPGDARLRVVAATARDHAQVSHAPVRNKKAPLMAKTLQFMRGRLKR